MQDFREHLTVDMSGKTHAALIAFLKKHGAGAGDISRFIEDAVTWRIIDRELAFRHAEPDEAVAIFSQPPFEPLPSDAVMNG